MEQWGGKTVGRFRLTAMIAQEPGRITYRAEEAGATMPVAVTIIAPPTADDRWFADRVARGLRSYTGLTHPNLLPLREVGEQDGAAYAVTPLVEGRTLRTRLGRPLSIADAGALLTPVADALDAVHDRHLIHGDLRPERILLAADGRVLLTGTGIAPIVADAARLSADAPEPTPEEATYRAPESAHGAPSDGRADIYSLGVVAYEALTGRPPFTVADAGGSAEALSNLHVGAAPPAPRTLNPTLSEAVEAALLRALAKSTYERYARASAFIEALAGDGGPRTEGRGQRAEERVPPVMTAPAAPVPSAPVVPVPGIPVPVVPAMPPASGGYAYVPTVVPPPRVTEPAAGDAARQLVAAREQLVSTLAAVAWRRSATPLALERQRLVQTLRTVTPAVATKRPNTSRPPAAPPAPRPVPQRARPRQEPRPKPTVAAPATSRWDMQYYEFSVPPGEAALSLLKSIGPLFGGFLVAGLLFSGLRCLLLPAVLFGIGFLLSWLAAINRTIACDQAGFSVTTGLLPWQKATRLHTWSDVRGLRYFEKASANQNAPAVAHFAVDTDSGEAFDQTDAFEGYDFGLLVETFGRMTPHLPYTWAYSQRVKGRPVLENAGMYSKVTRGSAPLGPG